MYRNFLLLGTLALVSCGGGGGSSGPTNSKIIDRSGYTVGAISGFGSVIVNGVTFSTGGAVITIDDQPGDETDLRVGQVVTVVGTIDGAVGSAETVTTDPTIRGAIQSIDLGARSLRALNTTVQVTADTVFDSSVAPQDLSTLSVGDLVEVYGYRTATGNVFATFIARTLDTESELVGVVANLNSTDQSFFLGELQVSYVGADLVGFSGMTIDNGDLVEVEGSGFDANGVLIADRLELENIADSIAEAVDSEVEIEGLVTRLVSGTEFELAQTLVLTDSSTEYSGGNAGDIQADVFVEVEGVVTASGKVLASSIEFRTESNLEAEASVESVAGDSVTLLGLELFAIESTQLIDESDQKVSGFSLADVAVGDYVKIKAVAGTNRLTLNLLKRKNAEDKLKLKGIVTGLNGFELSIQTATIRTDSSTEYEIDENAVGQTEFFDALEVGSRVSAEGQSPAEGVLLAEELELED